MKPHSAATMFPMLSERELRELANDILANGQSHPITTWNGQIIDGRNRLAACEIAGVEPIYKERSFSDDADVAHFVVSVNLHRRHLSESQRALIAAKLLPMFEEKAAERVRGPGKGKEVANLPPQKHLARDEAAQLVSVSPRSVQSAKRVLAEGASELIAAVESGEVSVSSASSIIDKPKTTQAALVKSKGVKAAAKKARRKAHVKPKEPDIDWRADVKAAEKSEPVQLVKVAFLALTSIQRQSFLDWVRAGCQ